MEEPYAPCRSAERVIGGGRHNEVTKCPLPAGAWDGLVRVRHLPRWSSHRPYTKVIWRRSPFCATAAAADWAGEARDAAGSRGSESVLAEHRPSVAVAKPSTPRRARDGEGAGT